MKTLLIAFLLIVVLAVAAIPAFADEPAPGTKQDNLCNVGGAMAGKCTTAWAWTCGWYLARFYFLKSNNGLTEWQAVFTPNYSEPQPFSPVECESLYPAIPWQGR